MLIDFRQLFPKYNIRPNGVLHIGANIGEEAPIYCELNVYNQVWIEANRFVYDKLRMNIKDNPNAFAINACISDVEDEDIIFHVSNNGSQSSSILELGTHLTAHPEVHYITDVPMKGRRIDKLFPYPIYSDHMSPKITIDGRQLGLNNAVCDFLNIDLQGAELKALRGMGDLLHQFKWAYLEVNKEELYKGCALVGEIDEYLKGFGFNRVETKWCGNTGWGDALYIKQ